MANRGGKSNPTRKVRMPPSKLRGFLAFGLSQKRVGYPGLDNVYSSYLETDSPFRSARKERRLLVCGSSFDVSVEDLNDRF